MTNDDGTCSVKSWAPGGADVTGVEPWYNASGFEDSCPSDCPPCASCLIAHERSAERLTRPAGCDCRLEKPRLDPCFQPTSCGCFCQHYDVIVEACPGLAGTF
jgi:hypothetical protein